MRISETLTIIELTMGSTWIVPKNWNSFFHGPLGYANQIECIGGGAGGGGGIDGVQAGFGGGSGAYSIGNGLILNPNTEISYKVGLGGNGGRSNPDQPDDNGEPGGDTWFYSADLLLAKGGTCPYGGFVMESVGDNKYNGENGIIGPKATSGYAGGVGFFGYGNGGSGGKNTNGKPGSNGIIIIKYYAIN